MKKYSEEFMKFVKEQAQREECEEASALRDILTDCMHYAFDKQLSFPEIVESAIEVFEAELEDDEDFEDEESSEVERSFGKN